MANTEVYNISDELTIPLKNNEDGTEHFAVGKVSLSMDKTNKDYETYSATLESKEGLITDIIFSVFGSHTIDEAKSNPEVLKSEILQNYLVQTLFMECPLISCISNISLKSGYRG